MFWMLGMLLTDIGVSQENVDINVDELLSLEIQQAIAREDQSVLLSVEASSEIVAKDIQKAKQDALYQAFRHSIELAVKQMVPPERLEEVQKAVQGLIYQKARLFIQQYQLGNSKVQEQKIYTVPVKLTLNLKMLHEALLENKILMVDYGVKEIRFHGFQKHEDYQFMKTALEKRIQNLKRLVETYQTKKKITVLVETSSSLQEIMERLNSVRAEAGAPLFKVSKDEEKGGLDITFVP